MTWELQPGETILRKELHDDYGGKRQGGISPSNSSPNVMVFTDPETGHQHGYLDRWEEGLLHYTGEGQTGPQEMSHGNAQILNHAQDGRALRVFQGSAGEVTYVGRFELGDPPYYYAQAPESGGDRLRRVIMFRLRPAEEVATPRDNQRQAHRTVAPETDMATVAVAKLAGDGSKRGQAFQANKHIRRATELRAMQLVTQHYQDLGWSIDDVSATESYDLRATRDGVEKHIEVKGTTSLGQEVLLTPNEVAHARSFEPVALAVVSNIQIEDSGSEVEASGGNLLVHDPWDIGEGHLAPLGYAYSVPGVMPSF